MYALIHIYDNRVHSIRLFEGPDARASAVKLVEGKLFALSGEIERAKALAKELDINGFVAVNDNTFTLTMPAEPVFCGHESNGDTIETFFCHD